MAKTSKGVRLFTCEHIVAVLRAIPQSNDTYKDIARRAEHYGASLNLSRR